MGGGVLSKSPKIDFITLRVKLGGSIKVDESHVEPREGASGCLLQNAPVSTGRTLTDLQNSSKRSRQATKSLCVVSLNSRLVLSASRFLFKHLPSSAFHDFNSAPFSLLPYPPPPHPKCIWRTCPHTRLCRSLTLINLRSSTVWIFPVHVTWRLLGSPRRRSAHSIHFWPHLKTRGLWSRSCSLAECQLMSAAGGDGGESTRRGHDVICARGDRDKGRSRERAGFTRPLCLFVCVCVRGDGHRGRLLFQLELD